MYGRACIGSLKILCYVIKETGAPSDSGISKYPGLNPTRLLRDNCHLQFIAFHIVILAVVDPGILEKVMLLSPLNPEFTKIQPSMPTMKQALST